MTNKIIFLIFVNWLVWMSKWKQPSGTPPTFSAIPKYNPFSPQAFFWIAGNNSALFLRCFILPPGMAALGFIAQVGRCFRRHFLTSFFLKEILCFSNVFLPSPVSCHFCRPQSWWPCPYTCNHCIYLTSENKSRSRSDHPQHRNVFRPAQ